jgi:hypothetical protein
MQSVTKGRDHIEHDAHRGWSEAGASGYGRRVTTWVWREALEVLSAVLPGSTGFLLDQIEGIPAEAWRRFRVDEDDVTLGERLVAEVGTALGNDLIVVTDASWRPDVGPFITPSWHLAGLIRDHQERTGEPFFNGDLVILSPDDGALVALHRAGLMAVTHGRPSPRPPLWPLVHLVETSVFADWEPPLEWCHLIGEIYPDTAITLPSGRLVNVRWFQADAAVSFIAPTGDFQVSFRGPLEDLDDVYTEFLDVAGLGEGDVHRLPQRP